MIINSNNSGLASSPPKAQGPKPKACFTLIELLVVVAIIAVLVAILLPSLKRVRQHALWTICAGRLHVWGQSLTMYSDSNNGILIPRADFSPQHPITDSWDRYPMHWWAGQRNHLRDKYGLIWPVWSPPEMEADVFPLWAESRDGAYRIRSGYLYLPRHRELALSYNKGVEGPWPLCIQRDLRTINDEGEMMTDHSPLPLVTDINFFGSTWLAAHKTTGGDYWGTSTEIPEISHSVWPDGHVETRFFSQYCTRHYEYTFSQVTW